MEFNDYFNYTWVSGSVYNCEDWNQLDDIEVRTNNWCESWNSDFSKRFSKSHHNIFTLVETIKKSTTYYNFIYFDQLRNPSKYSKIKFLKVTEELKEIVGSRETLFFE